MQWSATRCQPPQRWGLLSYIHIVLNRITFRASSTTREGQVMKFVVIGGDAAGMSAASRAKRQDGSLQVTVLEQTDTVSYSA